MKQTWFFLLLSISICLTTNSRAEINAAHQNISDYQGTETCVACHQEAAKQVAQSIHYQLRSTAKNVQDAAAGAIMGMAEDYCGLPASQASISWLGILQPRDSDRPPVPGGCGLCHVGYGPKPNPPDKLTDADYENIDCLLCHGPNYYRTGIREGKGMRLVPASSVDVVATARAVQKPTNEMCLRCHAKAGGGPNAKHGVIPTPGTDIHMDKGMQCLTCHKSQGHKIAGCADLKGCELPDQMVSCTGCHAMPVHKNLAVIDEKHGQRLDCKVCHIPLIARDPAMPTVTFRDWSKPGIIEKTGLYSPAEKKSANVIPVYRWWNRKINKYPPAPMGSRQDADAVIYPWKKVEAIVPVDEQTNQVIPLKLGPYFELGDLEEALRKGAEETKMAYSGKWKTITDVLHFSVNHQIAPKAQALACADCHAENGRLDLAALGYNSEETKKLTSIKADKGQD